MQIMGIMPWTCLQFSFKETEPGWLTLAASHTHFFFSEVARHTLSSTSHAEWQRWSELWGYMDCGQTMAIRYHSL